MTNKKRDFAALQKRWYLKLQKSGFKDIELNADLEPVKSTIRSDHASFDFLLTEDTESDIELSSLWECPKFNYWHEFLSHAYALPPNYKYRSLLIEIGEYGGYTTAMLTKRHISRQTMRTVVRVFQQNWKDDDDEC